MLMVIIFTTGCAGIKYAGWDSVRIEQEKPNIECIYKGWGMCSYSFIDSQLWHRKRAIRLGANLVIFRPDVNEGKCVRISPFGAGGSFGDVIIRSADYYYCPEYDK